MEIQLYFSLDIKLKMIYWLLILQEVRATRYSESQKSEYFINPETLTKKIL